MAFDNCGLSCVKYLTFIFNLIFFLSGLIILGFGIAVLIEINKSSTGIQGEQGVIIFIIVLGCITTIVAFFGCRGALQESYCNLITFVALVVLLLILEIAAIITCYVFRNKLQDASKEPLQTKWSKYDPKTNPTISKTVDTIQQEFACCGVTNATDWREIPWSKNGSMPKSCCKKSFMSDDECVNDWEKINNEGCLQRLKDVLEKEVLLIAGIAIAVALIHLFGIVFACCLAKAIKKRSEEVAPVEKAPPEKPSFITIQIPHPGPTK